MNKGRIGILGAAKAHAEAHSSGLTGERGSGRTCPAASADHEPGGGRALDPALRVHAPRGLVGFALRIGTWACRTAARAGEDGKG
jgi:hypothetical protein